MKYLILICTLIFTTCKSPINSYLDDNYTAINVKIGNTDVKLYQYKKNLSSKHLSFINIHHNEDTSAIAAKEFIEKNGGSIVILVHGHSNKLESIILNGKKYEFNPSQVLTKDDIISTLTKNTKFFVDPNSADFNNVVEQIFAKRQSLYTKSRNISFQIAGSNTTYIFDPNRIFTTQGIKDTLTSNSTYTKAAADEVSKFAKTILETTGITINNQINPNNTTLIALHNNTNANYSIKSYLDGGNEAAASKYVFQGSKTPDEDDFYFVTNVNHFNVIKKNNYNVILQDNINVPNDGSLSVYAGKNGLNYINVEAEHGKITNQKAMLEFLLQNQEFNLNQKSLNKTAMGLAISELHDELH